MSGTRIIQSNKQGLTLAAEYIRNGKLVSFPTETVYGLGANALDPVAVEKIFKAKERPLTDPLIVHVYDYTKVHQYIANPIDNKPIVDMYNLLAKKFWPGPLTMVLPVVDLPNILSCGSGCVGFRLPNHPVALDFLRECDLPIAAPSANKFGHISPTKSAHVYDDLINEDVLILDTDIECKVGIESTVIGLFKDEIKVYRLGGITIEDLSKYISIPINYKQFIANTTLTEVQVAPGQCIKHYSPNKPTYIVNINKNANNIEFNSLLPTLSYPINKCGLIDINKQLIKFKDIFCNYFDLSETNIPEECTQNLFIQLRDFEQSDVECILICRPPQEDGLWRALYDRIFRSASGNVIDLY